MSEEQNVQETQEEQVKERILSEASQIVDRSNQQILEWKNLLTKNTSGLRSISAHAVLNEESRNVQFASIIESVTLRRLETERAIAEDIAAFFAEAGISEEQAVIESLIGAALVAALHRPLKQFLYEQYGEQAEPSSGA